MHINDFDTKLFCNFNGISNGFYISLSDIRVKIADIQIFVKVNGVMNAVFVGNALEILHVNFIKLILRHIHIEFDEIKSQFRTQFRTFFKRTCFNQCGHTVVCQFHNSPLSGVIFKFFVYLTERKFCDFF